FPIASAAVYPNIFSAAGFQVEIMPPSVLLIMASSLDSTIAANWAHAALAFAASVTSRDIAANSFRPLDSIFERKARRPNVLRVCNQKLRWRKSIERRSG